jgi:hypothetical protein
MSFWQGGLRKSCGVVAVVLGIAAAGDAQNKPDFTGEWTLNRPESSLSEAASAMQSGAVTIEHREPMFRYKATLVATGNPIEYGYELKTDGSEVTGTQQGRRVVSSLRWDGSALVFVSRIESPDPDRTINIDFRYELAGGGRRLRAVERLRGGGRDQDNIWIFDRR